MNYSHLEIDYSIGLAICDNLRMNHRASRFFQSNKFRKWKHNTHAIAITFFPDVNAEADK